MEKLARFGLVAQGISFGLVAVLAIELALGKGGKATDREGALQTIAGNGIGRVIVFVLACGCGRWIVYGIALGIAGAALWNLYRAVSGKYKDTLKTGQMSAGELKWTTRIPSSV